MALSLLQQSHLCGTHATIGGRDNCGCGTCCSFVLSALTLVCSRCHNLKEEFNAISKSWNHPEPNDIDKGEWVELTIHTHILIPSALRDNPHIPELDIHFETFNDDLLLIQLARLCDIWLRWVATLGLPTIGFCKHDTSTLVAGSSHLY
jgi:hypothetical protein